MIRRSAAEFERPVRTPAGPVREQDATAPPAAAPRVQKTTAADDDEDEPRSRPHWTRPKRCEHGFLIEARLCPVAECQATNKIRASLDRVAQWLDQVQRATPKRAADLLAEVARALDSLDESTLSTNEASRVAALRRRAKELFR